MYELLILGSLMQRDMSGYKLRLILGNSVSPRRKISNSVIYPVFKSLAEKGYIEFYDEPGSEHASQMAKITQRGEAYLDELMAQPVEFNAKRESMYRFKIRAMAAVSSEKQLAILADYQRDVQSDVEVYQEVKGHLQELTVKLPAKRSYLKWSLANLYLSIQLAQTTLDWIAKQIEEIKMSSEGTK